MDLQDQKRFAVGTGLPFVTTDAILAQCLRIAGIPEAPWSPRNIYDDEILFKAGGGVKDQNGNVTRKSRYAGLSIIEAARMANRGNHIKEEPLKGRVEYHFEHTKEIQYLIDAYRDQENIVREGEGDAGDAIREIMRLGAGRLNQGETIMDEREALLRILCVALKTRIQYVNRWKDVTPVLHIKGDRVKSSESHGKHKIERFTVNDKFVPLNATDELLRKMQLI